MEIEQISVVYDSNGLKRSDCDCFELKQSCQKSFIKMPRNVTIVEYCGPQNHSSCGYCSKNDTSESHGMSRIRYIFGQVDCADFLLRMQVYSKTIQFYRDVGTFHDMFRLSRVD